MGNSLKSLTTPIHPVRVYAALVMMVILFGPVTLLLAFPNNRLLDILFGGIQIVIFWLIAGFIVHYLESKVLERARTAKKATPVNLGLGPCPSSIQASEASSWFDQLLARPQEPPNNVLHLRPGSICHASCRVVRFAFATAAPDTWRKLA